MLNQPIPLNLLAIGISSQAMEGLVKELRDGGYAVHISCAETLQDVPTLFSDNIQILMVGLGKEPVKLVSSLCALLQEHALDIPLLAYADANSQDHIVDVIHAGAQDVITANTPARILSAVQRELFNMQQRIEHREQLATDHLLQEIDDLILQAWDVVPLVTQLCQRVVDLFDFKLVWIGGKQTDGLVNVVAAAGDVEYLRQVEIRWDDTPKGWGTAGLAIKQGKPVVLAVDDPEFQPWREVAMQHGMRSILALPMIARGEVVGAFMLYSGHDDVFHHDALERFLAFSNRVAVALLVAQEQQQLRLLNAAMSSATNAMFITSLDGSIIWFNEALNAFSGYASDEIMGRNPSVFCSGEHDTAFWKGMWKTVLKGKGWRGDVINRRKDGKLFSVMQTVTPLFNERGELINFLAVQHDVSEKRELEREIQYLAYHDVLTGLPNRVLFQDRMQLAVNQAKRDKTVFALLFVDLDGFKEVNDTHGHAAGDRLLQTVASRLCAVVREADTVARLSGDEFTVLLRDVVNDAGLHGVLEKLLACVAEPCDLGEHIANVTASIGISLYPEHALGVEKLMMYADQAMYSAKKSGKNRYQFFQPKPTESDQS